MLYDTCSPYQLIDTLIASGARRTIIVHAFESQRSFLTQNRGSSIKFNIRHSTVVYLWLTGIRLQEKGVHLPSSSSILTKYCTHTVSFYGTGNLFRPWKKTNHTAVTTTTTTAYRKGMAMRNAHCVLYSTQCILYCHLVYFDMCGTFKNFKNCGKFTQYTVQ